MINEWFTLSCFLFISYSLWIWTGHVKLGTQRECSGIWGKMLIAQKPSGRNGCQENTFSACKFPKQDPSVCNHPQTIYPSSTCSRPGTVLSSQKVWKKLTQPLPAHTHRHTDTHTLICMYLCESHFSLNLSSAWHHPFFWESFFPSMGLSFLICIMGFLCGPSSSAQFRSPELLRNRNYISSPPGWWRVCWFDEWINKRWQSECGWSLVLIFMLLTSYHMAHSSPASLYGSEFPAGQPENQVRWI